MAVHAEDHSVFTFHLKENPDEWLVSLSSHIFIN